MEDLQRVLMRRQAIKHGGYNGRLAAGKQAYSHSVADSSLNKTSFLPSFLPLMFRQNLFHITWMEYSNAFYVLIKEV